MIILSRTQSQEAPGIQTVLAPFLEVTEDAYEGLMQLNLKAVLFISQAVAKDLVQP